LLIVYYCLLLAYKNQGNSVFQQKLLGCNMNWQCLRRFRRRA